MSMSSGLTPASRSRVEPRPLRAAELRPRARLLVVAGAGVDQDGQAVLADQEALDGDGQKAARRILEARLKPVAVGVEMGLRAVGEDLERRQQRAFRLDDALQRDAPKVQWLSEVMETVRRERARAELIACDVRMHRTPGLLATSGIGRSGHLALPPGTTGWARGGGVQ